MVDASRARLFTYERSSEAEGVSEQLSEQRDLVNPARRKRPSELFSDSGGASRTGNLQYGLDDHRDAHVDALDSDFARSVIGNVAEMVKASAVQRLILCASPRMLGELRSASNDLRRGLRTDELPRNLVKLSPSELRDQLASYGLLPAASRRATSA
ncbi:MAG TPA: host attachment protein [Kofleriaceae bacterium]|nr:host attachment protein [Kofleriaceae bacterium]